MGVALGAVGRGLPGCEQSSSCGSSPSLAVSAWDEAHLLSDPMEMFPREEDFFESLQ